MVSNTLTMHRKACAVRLYPSLLMYYPHCRILLHQHSRPCQRFREEKSGVFRTRTNFEVEDLALYIARILSTTCQHV